MDGPTSPSWHCLSLTVTVHVDIGSGALGVKQLLPSLSMLLCEMGGQQLPRALRSPLHMPCTSQASGFPGGQGVQV